MPPAATCDNTLKRYGNPVTPLVSNGSSRHPVSGYGSGSNTVGGGRRLKKHLFYWSVAKQVIQ